MIAPDMKGQVIALVHGGDTVLAMPRLRALEAALNPPAHGG